MEKWTYIFVFLIVFFQSCRHHSATQEENEQFVINELVLLRAEGLSLIEMMPDYTDNKEIESICMTIKQHYVDTHPDFLELCKGRVIGVKPKDMELMWTKIDNFLIVNDDNVDVAFLRLCHDNIVRSIALYQTIIEQNDWKDMCYFSFRALPDLYNQQGELRKIAQKVEPLPVEEGLGYQVDLIN